MESNRNKRAIEFVDIGKITGTFGRFGEVKIKILTDFPERFFEEKDFYLKLENQTPEKIKVSNARFHNKVLVLKITGIDDIENAKKLSGGYFQIPIEDVKKLPADNFYQFQIIGLSAFSSSGKYLGIIDGIINTPNHDVYIIKGEVEILIPAFKKYIKKIDLEKGNIIVEVPEEY